MARLQEILIGNIAIKLNLVNPSQLEDCLKEQEKTKPRKPLGLIMMEKGFITKEKLDELLKMQQETIQRKSEEYQKSLQDNLFGRIIIAKKYVQADDVYDAVKEQAELLQKGIRKRLGTILVEKGLLKEEQVKEVLDIQNKKVLYCEKCDLIFTVEWVLGRIYSCVKCGVRLLVPPKTIIVTETDSLTPKHRSVSYDPAPKITLPKEALQDIYKKMEERVSKIEIKPITTKKEENLFLNFIKFLLFKPYTLIALCLLIGTVVFINITLGRKEREADANITVKLPKEIPTSFLEIPKVSFDSALEFDLYTASYISQLFSNKVNDFCSNIMYKEGRFYNSKAQKPLTLLEAQECESNIKAKMKNTFQTLYHMVSTFEPMHFETSTKEAKISLQDFSTFDQDLQDITIHFKNGEISIGSILYFYGSSFGDTKNKLTLVLSWCFYDSYRRTPVFKFNLVNEKIRDKKELLSNYYVKLYFYLLPYFQSEGIIYGKLVGAEIINKNKEISADAIYCKEGG